MVQISLKGCSQGCPYLEVSSVVPPTLKILIHSNVVDGWNSNKRVELQPWVHVYWKFQAVLIVIQIDQWRLPITFCESDWLILRLSNVFLELDNQPLILSQYILV